MSDESMNVFVFSLIDRLKKHKLVKKTQLFTTKGDTIKKRNKIVKGI